jgi:hypothetical protein
MDLSTVTKPAVQESSNSYGTQVLFMAAGKTLKVETSPNGEDVLDITVPSGKVWEVSVTISIKETDV